MDIKNVTIKYLADMPAVIPVLAQWLNNEFHYLIPGKSEEYVIESLHSRMNYTKIPLSIIALKRNEIIGTVSLKISDMDVRNNLTPWLAGLFVKEEYRENGVGALLVESIEIIARQLGVRELFLYTPSAQEFYKRIGWVQFEKLKYKLIDVIIMNKSL